MRLLAAALLTLAPALPAGAGETPASEVVYFEPGARAAEGFTDPTGALHPSTGPADRSGIVSLGAWSDDPATGANDGRPTGLVLTWPFPVPNLTGPDIRVLGNNFGGFHEPGMIEVAAETTGTPGSWEDETFYLIRPSNYAALPADPRTAPTPITLATDGRSLYTEPHWQLPLTGYADVTPGGDLIDISDAIDLQGNPISLDSITYIRIRTITDSTAGTFGQISTEIDTITALHDLLSPLPTPAVSPGWSITPLQAAPPGWVIEALAIDPADSSLLTTQSDYRNQSATRILRDGQELRRLTPAVFASFITPEKLGYTDFVDGGGIEPLLGGERFSILQTFDLAGPFLSHNPVPFGTGSAANRISRLADDGSLTLAIDTGGFSGPIALTPEGQLYYAAPSDALYQFTPGETPLTLADATRTLSRPLNALANAPGSNLLAHDFTTLISIHTSDLSTTEIATSTLTLGALEMWAGEIYLVATDYRIPQSVAFRLTPNIGTPTITPLKNGAIATILPGTAATIETLTEDGTWEATTTTPGTSREGRTLTATSQAPTALFRLRTVR